MSDEGAEDADRPDDAVGLGLDEVLAALRHDLLTANAETTGAGGGYGLGVAEVEVELTAEVRRSVSGDASGGVKWFVLSADASAEAGRERTRAHRITLSLRPTVAADGGTGVGGGTGAAPIGRRVAGEPGEPGVSGG